MRQYQVPQFITVEDKVIGPFTIKQSLYLGAGALFITLIRQILQPFLFWPIAILIAAFAAALAFLKINEQPFPAILKNSFFFLIHPRMFMWKREPSRVRAEKQTATPKKETVIRAIPKLSESKLTDLAWSLDIKSRREE